MSTRVVDILVLMVKHALRHKTISAKTLINWNRYAWPTIQICEYSMIYQWGIPEFPNRFMVYNLLCKNTVKLSLVKLNLQGGWLRMMILMILLVVVFQRYAKKMQLFNTGSKRTLIRPLDVKEYRFLQKTRH